MNHYLLWRITFILQGGEKGQQDGFGSSGIPALRSASGMILPLILRTPFSFCYNAIDNKDKKN